MVDSPDRFVGFRTQRLSELPAGDALAAYQAHLHLAIALYSRGDSLADVRAQVQAAIHALEADGQSPAASFALVQPDAYLDALWGLSLAILLDTPTSEFHRRCVGQDQFIDRLLRLTGALVHPVETLLHPEPFGRIQGLFEEGGQRGEIIADYLRHWYDGLAATAWHDLHLQQDPAFVGYWSFELAALVRAFHVSDQEFQTNIFYPRDLVHQRAYRAWLGGAGEDEQRKQDIARGAEAVEDVKSLLGFVFGNAPAPADGTHLDASVQHLAHLFGFDGKALENNPEAMLAVLVRLLRATISTLRTSMPLMQEAEGVEPAEANKLVDALRQIEQQMGPSDGPDLDKLLAQMPAEQRVQLLGGSGQGLSDAAKLRLANLEEGLEALVADESMGLEALFAGLERLMQRFGPEFGIAPAQPYEVDPSLGDQVKQRIDEGLKGTSLDPDFDWSSLWRKD